MNIYNKKIVIDKSYIVFAITFILVLIIYLLPRKEKRTFDDIEIHYFDRFKTVKMGKYEQDGNQDNGLEDIEWYILDEKGDTALLITKDTIVSIPYADTSVETTWKDCILRMFLNQIFIKDNFTDKERSSIVTTFNSNSKINEFGNTSGDSTYDDIFVLSIEELEKYFKNDTERMACGNQYAKSLGLSLVSTLPTADTPIQNATYYWARDPGYHQSDVACVNWDGHINHYGFDCRTDGVGARPCMWVRKEALWQK